VSKFDETFNEPECFSDGTYVVTGKIAAAAAAARFSEYFGEEVKPESLEKDWVRFGFPPDSVAEADELGACWHTGSRKGKGSQPVWVYS